MRIKLTVAYDGTNYHGWQIQPNSLTIEECLNKAISELFNEDILIIGASRTDAGVHAHGNVAAFDVDTRMEPSRIAFAINDKLPKDIRVLDSMEVPDSFHPRFDAKDKEYKYNITNRRIYLPTERLYSYFYHRPLDINKMQRAANHLIGEHDFTSFASIHSQTNTFVRTLYECNVDSGDNGKLIISVRGNGFLYNMVRIIAGTLIKVGADAISCDEIPDILNAKNRSLAGPTAPAHGLILHNISYTIG